MTGIKSTYYGREFILDRLKFKAWDNDRKEMTDVRAIDWAEGQVVVTCHLEYSDGHVEKKYPEKDYGDDIIFLQCIGLEDFAGVKIYENYILQDNRNETQLCIKYSKDEGKYVGYQIDTTFKKVMNVVWYLNQQIIYSHQMKIIGNIYELGIKDID